MAPSRIHHAFHAFFHLDKLVEHLSKELSVVLLRLILLFFPHLHHLSTV